LQLSEAESVLKKMEGLKNLHELYMWSISLKDLALSCHEMIKDQSIQSAQNILSQIQTQLKEKFKIEHPTTKFECGYCTT